MNIDTAGTNTINDLTSFAQSSSARRNSDDGGFRDQLNSISDDKTETKKSESKSSDGQKDVDKKNVEKKDEPKVEDKKKSEEDAKVKDTEVKTDKTESVKPDKKLEGQAAINAQNPQYISLTEELQSILAANRLLNGGGLQNDNKIHSGIQTDVYTSEPTIAYQSIGMSDEDALFFSSLVKNTDMSMQSIAGEFQKSANTAGMENVQKTAKVSATLMNALSESLKNNQPFRIDFGKDVSVILRVDKDGNLNAQFIPGDKAVEAYLKNNLGFLKQRFDEQNLPYGEMNYSKSRQQNQENEKRNNKENNNE